MARCNIAKKVRFLGIDGFIVAPILLIMLAPSWTFLYILIIAAILLFWLEKRGLSLLCMARKIRTFFSGGKKLIRPPWRHGA